MLTAGREAIDAREAPQFREPAAAIPAPSPVIAPVGLIAHLARRPVDDRKAAIADLNRRVGNRGVTRMIMRQESDVETRVQAIRQELSVLSHRESANHRELNRLNDVAREIVESAGGDPGRTARPPQGNAPRTPDRRMAPITQTVRDLEAIEAGRGGFAQRAADTRGQINAVLADQERIRVQRVRLDQELTRINPRAQAGNLRRPPPPMAPVAPPPPPRGGGGGSSPPPSASRPAPTPRPVSPPPAPVTPRLQIPASELAAAAKQASTLKTVAGRFVKGMASVAAKVAGPLLAVVQLLDALELVEMTESAIKGEGFVFKAQLRQAAALSDGVDAFIKEYEGSDYHRLLKDLVETAERNDEKYSQYPTTPPVYWGTQELSEFCLGAREVVYKHADQARKLLEHVRGIETDVTERREFCERLLKNPTAVAAMMVPSSGTAGRVLLAQQDLQRIESILRSPRAALAGHVKTVEADHDLMYDNILQGGWAL
jgi:hypothetical protein